MPGRINLSAAMHYRLLPAQLKPLADKFYRSQRSPMRANAAAQLWVAQADDIIAALGLREVDNGLWLTGLLVTPTWRGQGIASQLLEQALQHQQAPVWLFCQPGLQPFYQRLGFTLDPDLPMPLQQRLQRYRSSKTLLAMGRLPLGTVASGHWALSGPPFGG